MRSLKEKLLQSYYNDYLLEYTIKQQRGKATALRQFIASIGLDYRDLTRKQIDRWADTKRYKDFKKGLKIKRIADEANVEESFIVENYNFFIENFVDNGREEEIDSEEVLSFLSILEAAKIKTYSQRHIGKKRSYRTKQEREADLKSQIIGAVNTGAIIDRGEGDPMFASGKRAFKSLGSGKVMIKRKSSSKSGLKFHRKTYKVY